jgi:putative inorganic carbon (HCO3(-)) transporter
MLLAVWVLRWIGTGRPGEETPLDLPLLVLTAMIPVGVWASTLPEQTLPKLTGLILGLATYRATIHAARSDRSLRWSLAVFLAIGLAMAAVGLVGTIWANKLPIVRSLLRDVPQLIRGLPGAEKGINANELGGTLTLFLPVSLAASQISFSKSGWGSKVVGLAAIVVTLCFGALLILTQSRSAWVGVGVGLGAMAWLRWRWAPWPLIGAALLLLGLGLVFLGPQAALQTTLESADRVPIEPEGRIEIWNRALYAIQDFPITGCGLGTFRQVIHILYPLFFVGPGTDIGHAHNVFLQVALDLGLPGLIAYLALVGTTFWLGWRVATAQSGAHRWLALGLVGALVAFHAYGLTDAIALGAKPGVAFWMVVALTAALWTVDQGDLAAEPPGQEVA